MAGRILIVDDVATNRIVLKVKLAQAWYETLQAADGAEALALARSERPDVILLDINLPDLDGIAVCRKLKADPVTADIPVVMITAFNDAESRLSALRAGAEEFLSKPLDDLVLLARLRSLARAKETEEELRLRETTCRELGFAETAMGYGPPGHVALIAGHWAEAEAWRRAIAPFLDDRISVFSRAEALTETHDDAAVPDVFLIAADLAQKGEGLRLMSELRSRPATRHAAICIVLPPEARETAATALDLGAADLMPIPVDAQEMALRIGTQLARKRQADRLRATVRDGLRLAVTDPLTGLYNRRYAMPHLTRIAERAAATGRSFAVMLADLDRFKAVNDTWGHPAGDAVLAEIAHRLRDNLRGVDLIARIGGEEFLIVMPDIALEAAHAAAERLCRLVSSHPVGLPGGGAVPATLSIGLAMGGTGAGASGDIDALIDAADHALLAAKAEGRNQVTVSPRAA